ncbi:MULTISPECIES: hypothetical protein [Flavobacteriaceae]|uniref:hypothetical protein n=1 Tax=Flavobacteriaceae TaxID=49546 RepID=UPI003A8F850A
MEQTFKPILFNTEMVRAILQGRKTQTRRTKGLNIVNKDAKNYNFISFSVDYNYITFDNIKDEMFQSVTNNIGNPGDILWVRESFCFFLDGICYKADHHKNMKALKWKPSIHMPKKACRIFLKITDIRVERIQDITEEDALSEGVEFYFSQLFQETRYKDYSKAKPGMFKPQRFYKTKAPILGYGEWREAKSSFQSLWESINSKDSWESNPWVWVISFERISKPEGFNEC